MDANSNGTAKHSAPPPNPPTIEEMRTQAKYLRVANRLKREMVEANVLESFNFFDFASFGGGTDLWQGLFPKSQAGGFVPPTQPMDRRGGRKYPIIINDTQLNSYRQASRVLVDTNAYAAGTLRNWVNYVIAKGMTYKAGGRDTDAAKRYAESGGQRDAMESKDESGHEHKGSGPGGGQFTSGGSGGSKTASITSKEKSSSSEFKKWFGDSKVADKDGRPKVMLHGTTADFDEFKSDKSGASGDFHAGKGFYFSDNPETADAWSGGEGGNHLPVYLSIESPFDFDADIEVDSLSEWGDAAKELGFNFDAQKFRHAIMNGPVGGHVAGASNGKISGRAAWGALAESIGRGGEKSANKIIESLGYDGIKHTMADNYGAVRDPKNSKQKNAGTAWVAFSPHQIKSAIGNKGSYSTASANIKESREVMESLDDGTEDEMAPTPLDRLAQATQHVMDRFCERNAWNAAAAFEEEQEDGSVLAAGSTGEREACWRTARDGGAFIEIFRLDGGDVDIRFVDPELIWGTPPGKTAEDGWSFGIQHKIIERIREDENGNQRVERHHERERIVAYYIRNSSPDENGSADDPSGRIVPARDIIQIKKPGEDREVKQSAPWVSFDTLDAFVRASNGQRAVSITAAYQGSIAQTWKHMIGTKEQIQSLQNGPTAGLGVGNTAPTIGTNRIPQGGGILRVPNSSEPVDLPTSNIQAYQMAFQGDLRQAGQAFCAPEYLVSGDASNGNFASSQEAGVPWVRGVEADQEHFKTPFLRLMWRVVQWAVKCEVLPREAIDLITIECEPTQVHKNNEGEMAGVMTQRLAAKVTSPQIEAAKIGNDWRKVITDIEEFAKISQPEQQPGGMPQLGQEQVGGEQEAPVDPRRSMAAQQAAQARGLQISESAESEYLFADVMEEWSDAAREAALVSRRAHSAARMESSEAKRKSKIANEASGNIGRGKTGTHLYAHITHKEAATEHDKAHKLYKAKADSEQHGSGSHETYSSLAGLHSDARSAHLKASLEHHREHSKSKHVSESAEEWITIPDNILPMDIVRDLMEGDDLANEKQSRIAKMREILRAKIGAA